MLVCWMCVYPSSGYLSLPRTSWTDFIIKRGRDQAPFSTHIQRIRESYIIYSARHIWHRICVWIKQKLRSKNLQFCGAACVKEQIHIVFWIRGKAKTKHTNSRKQMKLSESNEMLFSGRSQMIKKIAITKEYIFHVWPPSEEIVVHSATEARIPIINLERNLLTQQCIDFGLLNIINGSTRISCCVKKRKWMKNIMKKYKWRKTIINCYCNRYITLEPFNCIGLGFIYSNVAKWPYY